MLNTLIISPLPSVGVVIHAKISLMKSENNRDDAGTSPAITCATCAASCCRLEVMLMGDDDIPPELTAQDQWGGWVMARLDDGWCAALDRSTLLCRIYEHRPMICRDFQVGESDCLAEYQAKQKQ